jgi:hypothetical protein
VEGGAAQGVNKMGSWTSEKFPQFESAILRLTKQHRELEDEPLHLAISYGPSRDQQDIFLFEVIGRAAGEMVSPEQELFEATFASTPGFPMESKQRLHLVLTNPQELETALREEWPAVGEIVNAFRSRNYKVLYKDKVGQGLVKLIQARIHPRRGIVRG